VACYLVEARKTLLDQIVEMNDLFLTAMNRKSRTAVEKRRKSMRRRARDGLHRVLRGVDALAEAGGTDRRCVPRRGDAPALVEAAEACRAYERLEERGHLDAMLSRYGTLRQYLPSFLTLPVQAAAGSEPLLQAIDILRALDAGTRGPLTPADPHSFVQVDWRPTSSRTANSTAISGRSRSPSPCVKPCAPAVCSSCRAATTCPSGAWSMTTAAGR
jgi:hypothetical protein